MTLHVFLQQWTANYVYCVIRTYWWKFLLQVLFRDRHLQVADKNSSFLLPSLLNPFPISLPLSLLFRHPRRLRDTSFRFFCHGNTSGRSFWLPWWFSFHGGIWFGNINCMYRESAKAWKMQIYWELKPTFLPLGLKFAFIFFIIVFFEKHLTFLNPAPFTATGFLMFLLLWQRLPLPTGVGPRTGRFLRCFLCLFFTLLLLTFFLCSL